METFLAKSSVEKLKWVENLWNKWLKSRYNDNSFLQVSIRTIFDEFPGVAPQYLACSLSKCGTKRIGLSSKKLYHIVAIIQMFQKDQGKKVDIFKDEAYRSLRLAMDKKWRG